MTFLSRRKRQTTRHASPAKWAATIISTLLVCASVLSGVHAQAPQNSQTTTRQPTTVVPADQVVPVTFQPAQPKNGFMPRGVGVDEGTEIFIRTDLPGPQRLFMRESQAQFYDRIRQEAKKQANALPAIFPDETPISNLSYISPSYPRIDPLTRQPVGQMVETVEPSYVCHRRLLFEQPNFERIGWDFGVLQPGMHLATFYYDVALAPYHLWSNFSNRGECSVGKCLPGDGAPFTVPVERFSVTGVIGEMGAIIGGAYLLTHQ